MIFRIGLAQAREQIFSGMLKIGIGILIEPEKEIVQSNHGIGLNLSFGLPNKSCNSNPLDHSSGTYIPTELTKIQLEAKPSGKQCSFSDDQ